MFETLNFEAEPFEFEADYESDYEADREGFFARGRVPSFGQFLFKQPTPGGSGGSGATASATPKPPRGLALLRHFHVPKSPTTGAKLPRTQMSPATMNPGFVNASDSLVINTGATGLHTKLNALITGKYKKNAQQISVALVDLTGQRLFAPDYAGWRSTSNVFGASLPKIIVLYAAHQLRFDLQAHAEINNLFTKKALQDSIRKEWDAAGLARAQQPNLDLPFDYASSPPKAVPVVVTPSPALEAVIKCIFTDDCNSSVSRLMDWLGLGYIYSVVWQSGLFHPSRGGLWLTANYGVACDEHCVSCCSGPVKLEKALKTVSVSPPATSVQNASALAAATYFTLMTQGRMADDAASAAVRKALEPACSIFTDRTTPAPTKCGYVGKYLTFNDVALIEKVVGTGTSAKNLRFAIAMMTVGMFTSKPPAITFFQQVLADVETLIQQNNP